MNRIQHLVAVLGLLALGLTLLPAATFAASAKNRVRASKFDHAVIARVNPAIRVALPDLTVLNVELACDVPARSMRAKVRIANLSSTATSQPITTAGKIQSGASYDLTKPGHPMSTHFNTPAGFSNSQTRELEKNVTFSEGWYSVLITVDVQDSQAESNETNNTLTASVYCQ